MKKEIKSLAVVLAACFAFSASSTAFGYELSYDGAESNFTVSGKTGEEKAGQIITVKVEKDSSLIYARQTETDEKGEYKLTFNISENGESQITVSENGVLKSGSIYKSTPDEVTAVLERLNGSENEEAIIADKSKVLQIALEEFNDYKKSGLLADYLKDKSFDSLRAFLDTYNKGEFLVKLERSTSGAEALELFKAYKAEDMLYPLNAKEIFGGLTDSEKADVLEDVAGGSFKNDEDFSDGVFEAVILNEIKNASIVSEKWGVVEDNNDYLKFNLEKYENLGGKFNDFTDEIFADSISSALELAEKMEEVYDDLSESKSGGGSSGGGGKKSSITASASLGNIAPVEQTMGFDDIDNYEWAKSAILSLASDGVINGKGNRKFAPNDNVTRAEFVKIIMGAFDMVSDGARISFDDVAENHWGYKYIASAAREDIVQGINEKQFNPNGNITRQDMAVICHRMLKKLDIEIEKTKNTEFDDDSVISDYAKEAVKSLADAGIINGKGENLFEPEAFATRAEAAKIIYLLRSAK